MMAIMEDVTADPMRRDEMARAAAPFVHPKLSSITSSNTNVNFRADENPGILNIFAVPRGATINVTDGKAIAIDGTAVELATIKPFEGTPPLEMAAITDQSAPAPIIEHLEVTELEQPGNVTRLDSFVRRRDEPDEGSGAPA
jgi:hypothetical protein